MLSNFFPVKFSDVRLCNDKPLWKQIISVYLYEWDEAPLGFTIIILGFEINFLLGKWTD